MNELKLIERNMLIMKMQSRSNTALGKLRRLLFMVKVKVRQAVVARLHKRQQRRLLADLKRATKLINQRNKYKVNE